MELDAIIELQQIDLRKVGGGGEGVGIFIDFIWEVLDQDQTTDSVILTRSILYNCIDV